MRGNKVVMPEKLWKQTIQLAHEGHQEMVRTKSQSREKVWWPNLDKQVEKLIRACHPCQLVGPRPKPEPIRSTPLPQGPWSEIAVDLLSRHLIKVPASVLVRKLFLATVNNNQLQRANVLSLESLVCFALMVCLKPSEVIMVHHLHHEDSKDSLSTWQLITRKAFHEDSKDSLSTWQLITRKASHIGLKVTAK